MAADLREADLSLADLSGANLTRANLSGALLGQLQVDLTLISSYTQFPKHIDTKLSCRQPYPLFRVYLSLPEEYRHPNSCPAVSESP